MCHIKQGVVLKIQVKLSEGSVVWMWFCVQQWKMEAGSVTVKQKQEAAETSTELTSHSRDTKMQKLYKGNRVEVKVDFQQHLFVLRKVSHLHI